MNLKVLFVVFLCLLNASIMCNAATVMLNEPQEWSWKEFTTAGHIGHLINNGTEPAGDPIGGGGWPGPT